MEELNFKKFDINNLLFNDKGDFANPKIVMLAKSCSGKSWLIRDIMYHMKDIPCGSVVCPTEEVAEEKFYGNFVPESFIHYELNENILPLIFRRQEKMMDKNKKRKLKNEKPVDFRTFLIMDDCMADARNWVKDPITLKLFNQGRHYGITFILALQYIMAVSPSLRTNIDFIFLLREDNKNNRKKIYDNFCGDVFPDINCFNKIFTKLTENYSAMVINNRARGTLLTDKIFWYRAKYRDSFTLGIPSYLKFHEENFDPNYKEKKRFNFANLNRKSNFFINLIK